MTRDRLIKAVPLYEYRDRNYVCVDDVLGLLHSGLAPGRANAQGYFSLPQARSHRSGDTIV